MAITTPTRPYAMDTPRDSSATFCRIHAATHRVLSLQGAGGGMHEPVFFNGVGQRMCLYKPARRSGRRFTAYSHFIDKLRNRKEAAPCCGDKRKRTEHHPLQYRKLFTRNSHQH